MQRVFRRLSVLARLSWTLVLLLSTSGYAGVEWDEKLGFRRWAHTAVTNPRQPLFQKEVDREIRRFFESSTRFELDPEAVEWTAENFPTDRWLGTDGKPDFRVLDYSFVHLRAKNVQALLLTDIRTSPENPELVLHAWIVDPATEFHVFRRSLPDRVALPEILAAVKEGLAEITRAIPFVATVIERDGYRVVLDQGQGYFRPGMKISTYSLDEVKGEIGFRETGKVELNRIEPHLSFGTVLVEKQPRTIGRRNKILARDFPETPFPMVKPGIVPLLPLEPNATRPVAQSAVGSISVDGVGQSVVLNRVALGGVTAASSSLFLLGTQIRGRLWLTRRTLLDLSFLYGTTSFQDRTVPNISLSGTFQQFRGGLGYRIPLSRYAGSPSIKPMLGYSNSAFLVDDTVFTMAPSTVRYQGLFTALDFEIPISQSLLVGIDVYALPFPYLTEGAFTSATSSSQVTFWDFGVRMHYAWTPEFSVSARAVFQSSSAQLQGQGTKTQALASMSQNSRSLWLGATYSF